MLWKIHLSKSNMQYSYFNIKPDNREMIHYVFSEFFIFYTQGNTQRYKLLLLGLSELLLCSFKSHIDNDVAF